MSDKSGDIDKQVEIENKESDSVKSDEEYDNYSKVDDDLEGEGIPVIDDEEYDNDLQGDLEDDDTIQNDKDKLSGSLKLMIRLFQVISQKLKIIKILLMKKIKKNQINF